MPNAAHTTFLVLGFRLVKIENRWCKVNYLSYTGRSACDDDDFPLKILTENGAYDGKEEVEEIKGW